MGRKYAAEFLGTILLVFFGAGAATLILGYRFFGSSLAAGIVAVALAFGLIDAAGYWVAQLAGGIVGALRDGALPSLGVPRRAHGRSAARGRAELRRAPAARGAHRPQGPRHPKRS